jgi:hypothetical protein
MISREGKRDGNKKRRYHPRAVSPFTDSKNQS